MIINIVFAGILYVIFNVVLSMMPLSGSLHAWLSILGLIIIASQSAFIHARTARMLQARNRGAFRMFRRFLEGDLTFRTSSIKDMTRSRRLSLGFQFLSQGLLRVFSKFQRVLSDSEQTAQQLVSMGNHLSQSALEGSSSLDITSEAIENVYRSQTTLHESIERLSVAGEDTSSSILEMGASLEEVVRFSKILHDQVERVTGNVDDIFSSLKTSQEHVQHLGSFSVETASSMQEMHASISEVDRNSQIAAKKAEESQLYAEDGKQSIEGMVNVVEGVQSEMDSIHTTMANLQGKTDQIGDVVKVITDITKQTNLLALNAAIIAAQGKDKGKGFAVVADEIRDLSERTAFSTDEIGALILSIRTVVENLASQLDQMMERIRFSVTTAHQVSSRFDGIMKELQATMSAVGEIASMAREQSRNSTMVAEAVEEVSDRMQSMAKNIDQQVEKTRTLNESSKRILDGANHILRSAEEQKKGTGIIHEAVDNVRKGIDDLVGVSNYITNAHKRIMGAVGSLKDTISNVSNSSTSLKMTSEAIYSGSRSLNSIVQEFKSSEALEGSMLRCHITWRDEYCFDPLAVQYMATNNVSRHIYETLVDYDVTTQPTGLLATSWDLAHSGREYTFTLKKGVQFHNGKPMTARDVWASFHRTLHPQSPSRNKGLFRCIGGVDEYLEGSTRTISGIQVVDDLHIRFSLNKPVALLPALLSLGDAVIVPEERASTFSSGSTELEGTGPFKLNEVARGKHVRLLKNSAYHVSQRPYLNEIEFDISAIPQNRIVTDLEEDRLHMLLDLPPHRVDSMIDEGCFVVRVPTLRTSFLIFNHEYEPLKHVQVRKALNYALNRERINSELYDNQNTLSAGILPPSLLSQARFSGYLHDPDTARDLLSDAGYPEGLRLNMWVRDEEDIETSMVPFMQEDFAKVGVFIDIQKMPAAEIQRRRRQGEQSALYLSGWYPDYPDPDSFFSPLFLSESDVLNIHYHDEDMEMRIRSAQTELDNRKREELYQELNHDIYQNAHLLFLFHPPHFILHHPDIMDIVPAVVHPFIRFSSVWRRR